MKKIFTFFAVMTLFVAGVSAQSHVMGAANGAGKDAALAKGTKATKALNVKAVKAMSNPLWDSDTMSYCGNEAFYTTVGTASDTVTMYWGIKIEASALVGRNTITAVQFYAKKTGNYNMNLVFGDNPTLTAAHSQVVTVAAADTGMWKVVTLATPATIPANQALWVTLSFTGSYPAACVEGNPYVNGTYASLTGDVWSPLSDLSSSLTFTWMIRVVSDMHTTPAPYVELAGPTAVLTGTAATWTATSPNTDSWAWYVNGEAQSTTSNTLTYTFDEDADSNMVVVEATNDNGNNVVRDTIYVDSYTCNGISSFPYTQGFESNLRCWTMVSADTANNDRFGIFEDTLSHGGNQEFRFSSYFGATDYNQFLISPEITLPEEGQYMVKFWYRGYRTMESFRVKVSTTTADTAAFTQVLDEIVTTPIDWTVAAYVLPAGTKYVAIDYFADYAYYLFVDDLSIEALTAPEVTLEGHDYVKVGNTIHYRAYPILADTLMWFVDDEEVTGNGNVLDYVFTTADTHYVSVKAINSIDTTTATLAVEAFVCDTNEIVYVPTFDNGFGCWDTVSLLTHGAGWYTTAEIELGEGQVYSMSAQSSFFGLMDLDIDNWLISPYIASAEGNYEIAWKARTFDGTYHYDHYSVYVIAGTDTTQLFSETLGEADTTYGWRTVSLPASLSGNFRIAFRHHDCQGGYVLLLDSIQVRNLTAPYVTVEGPATVESGVAVTFTATSGTATSYAWSIDGNAVAGSTNTLTYTFDNAGNYTLTVTATNAAGSNQASTHINVYACDAISEFPWTENFDDEDGFECWKFVDADGDGANWFNYVNPQSPLGHNNSYGMAMSASYDNNYGALTPDNWMMLPGMNLPEGSNLILSWYEKGQDTGYFAEKYSVYISTTGRDVENFTNAAATYTTTKNWIGRNVELSQYAGQTIYIAFRHHDCTDMFYLDIDDIKISTDRVSIDRVESSNLSLYPNPATDMVSVSAEGIEGSVNVQIVDLNGRVMMEQNGNAQRFIFDVSNLSQGAYFVRMTGENVNAVRKLIVK